MKKLQHVLVSVAHPRGALVAALALGLCLAAVPTGTVAAGPDRLRQFLSDAGTLRTDFAQTVLDESGQVQERAQGVMHLSRPGRFRWEYTSPHPQIIVGDGREVWVYDPDLSQVTVRPQDEALGASPASLLTSTRPVEESFAVSDLGDRQGLEFVSLKPRGEGATFADIRLGFADDRLAVMELEDNFGQTTVLEFTGLDTEAVVGEDTFQFEPPPDADVIRE